MNFNTTLSSLSLLGCTLLGLCLLGCSDNSSELVKISTSIESKSVESDSVQKAMRDIPRMLLLDRRVATTEVTRQFNSWAIRQEPSAGWSKTELISTLPELISRSTWAENLPKYDFEEPQCDYIFQCRLMKKANDWVLANPYRDGLFAPWLEKQKESLPEKDGLRLEQALKLFDWTVRNVWPEGNAKDIEKLALNPLLPLVDDGLGYTQLPWHTMIRARGDFVARARVFSQLAFQQGIPVAWVAIPGITPDQYKLWLLGIPVGDQIYLLEPKMGIPLPGPGQVGIATLADAKKDPSVLRRAKVIDTFDYPVAQADISGAFLVLDLEPFALSQSMHQLEKVLAGENRMKLAANADTWKSEFLQADPKLEVRLWSLPWFMIDYTTQLRNRIKDSTPFTANYMARMALYIDESAVSQARSAHLMGNHQTDLDQQGAPNLYMGLRIDDETLERLPFDRDLQASLMIYRFPNEDLNEFQLRIRQFQVFYRQSKLEGSLYLSMLHFDLGNHDTSMSWADRWMLKVKGTEPWHPCCWYLIARNLEQLGKIDEAIEMYKKSPSPQEAGNRIRARLLAK